MEYCSFWAIAKKNIENRSPEELAYLYKILVDSIESLVSKLLEKDMRFEWIGNPDILPPHIVKLLDDTRDIAKQ